MPDILVINNQITPVPTAFMATWGDTPVCSLRDDAADADPALNYFLSAVHDGLHALGYDTLNNATLSDLQRLLEPEPLPDLAWADRYSDGDDLDLAA